MSENDIIVLTIIIVALIAGNFLLMWAAIYYKTRFHNICFISNNLSTTLGPSEWFDSYKYRARLVHGWNAYGIYKRGDWLVVYSKIQEGHQGKDIYVSTWFDERKWEDIPHEIEPILHYVKDRVKKVFIEGAPR
jgi:hypothetical protein